MLLFDKKKIDIPGIEIVERHFFVFTFNLAEQIIKNPSELFCDFGRFKAGPYCKPV